MASTNSHVNVLQDGQELFVLSVSIEIFHNNNCLSELRVSNVIILMHFVTDPSGVESGGHSYCCGFGKSVLNAPLQKIIVRNSKYYLILSTLTFALTKC